MDNKNCFIRELRRTEKKPDCCLTTYLEKKEVYLFSKESVLGAKTKTKRLNKTDDKEQDRSL